MKEKNKIGNKNFIVFFSIIIYVFIYKFFVYEKLLKYNESITASFFLLLFVLSLILYGFRLKTNEKYHKSFAITFLVFALFYFAAIYGVGIATGFLNNAYSLKPISVFNNTFFLIVNIIMEELVRFIFIKANKNSKLNIFFITFLLALLEIIITIRYSDMTSFYNVFKIISIVVFPTIIKNIMLSYCVYYDNYKIPIIYRMVTELYVYIVPFQPDLSDYLNSICLLLLPFLIIINMARQTDSKTIVKEDKKYKLFKLSDIPFVVVFVLIYCLICGFGPYKIVGIETGSMTPNLNIGDAVIIIKKYNPDNLKVGDIIAYKNKENILVIHRIKKINNDQTFITKGDANNVADNEYVKREQIKGKVMFKIPYIAYPALMFK